MHLEMFTRWPSGVENLNASMLRSRRSPQAHPALGSWDLYTVYATLVGARLQLAAAVPGDA